MTATPVSISWRWGAATQVNHLPHNSSQSILRIQVRLLQQLAFWQANGIVVQSRLRHNHYRGLTSSSTTPACSPAHPQVLPFARSFCTTFSRRTWSFFLFKVLEQGSFGPQTHTHLFSYPVRLLRCYHTPANARFTLVTLFLFHLAGMDRGRRAAQCKSAFSTRCPGWQQVGEEFPPRKEQCSSNRAAGTLRRLEQRPSVLWPSLFRQQTRPSAVHCPHVCSSLRSVADVEHAIAFLRAAQSSSIFCFFYAVNVFPQCGRH